MENVETETTLRDDLAASFDAVEAGVTTPDAPPIVTEPIETDEQKADRLRDEQGRFAKADEKKASAPQVKSGSSPEGLATPAAAEPAKKNRPSSWKKDYDAHWEKFDPTVQDYILQRESEFAKGVSTYKQEAESARALNEAIAPFQPLMQQHNVQAAQIIPNLLAAHASLATGSAQDKVMMGAKLIRDYGIDPQQLFQVLSGAQPYQQPQTYQPPQPQFNIDEVVEQKLTQREIQSEFNKFVAEAPTKYQHYEAVKDTMAGLLQAGLAQDYKSAYEAALRHPRHADLYEQEQQQRLQQEASAQAAQKQAVVNKARSNAVSVKSSTPSGTMATAKGNTSLRDDLSAAFDQVTSSRV